MKNIYMIGNTHFDPVWLWRWDEAMASIRSTFRSALDRMENFGQYSQTVFNVDSFGHTHVFPLSPYEIKTLLLTGNTCREIAITED